MTDETASLQAETETALAPDPAPEAPPQQPDTQPEQPREPLAPEEIARRYDNVQRALRQERQQRQSYEQKLAAIEARLNQAPQTEDDPLPDPSEDPIGALEQLIARHQRETETANQRREREQQEQTQRQQFDTTVQRINEDVTEFATTTPDYQDAAQFLAQARLGEYQTLGYSPQDAQAALNNEIILMAQQAQAGGRNFAEVVYTLAKGRGFASQAAARRLETVAQGQAAARSLGSAGRANDAPDMAALADLEGAAFDQAFDKMAQRAKAAR